MSTLRNSTLAALAAACVAGCSFIPAYERPAAPVPGAFPYPGASEGKAAAAIDWQQFFTDARLRELISTALANNRDLRIAVLNIEQARAQYDIRRADIFPSVGVGVNASRAPSPVNGQQSTSYQAGLSLTAWEIDFFGRLRSLSE